MRSATLKDLCGAIGLLLLVAGIFILARNIATPSLAIVMLIGSALITYSIHIGRNVYLFDEDEQL